MGLAPPPVSAESLVERIWHSLEFAADAGSECQILTLHQNRIPVVVLQL
jgi:hypothetical protein